MKKQWFPVEHTNVNRAKAGSLEGIAGRTYPILVAEKMRKDKDFLRKVCAYIHRDAREIKDILCGKALSGMVESVIQGRKTPSKTTLRIVWKDNTQTNFIVKKSGPAHICLKKVEWFIPEFEAQFKKKVPPAVREALLLFVGRHPRQKEILDSISVNFVGDDIRDDVERKYHNRLTLASMYGYKVACAKKLLEWMAANSAEITEFCFSRGAAKDSGEFAEFIWYHSTNGVDSDFEIFDLKALVRKIKKLPKSIVETMVGAHDDSQVGSALNVPFGDMQYHEDGIEFRHDRDKIVKIFEYCLKSNVGSKMKRRGHDNEMKIAKELNDNKEFRSHFCDRVGRRESDFKVAEAGGLHAAKDESVLGDKTTGKTDVIVYWKNGERTNISIKMAPSGQVYLVTASNFIAVYEAQYNVIVPSRVRRALAFFVGEDPESRAILEATDISVDGKKARGIAIKDNYRLMFNVIKNYDNRLAEELLAFLKDKIENVFELSFVAGAVKDKSLWSHVLWYKNLVDSNGKGLDYMVPMKEVVVALMRKHDTNIVEPGPQNAGSTIHLPFGHLQYHKKQLEFYQRLKKIQQLVTD